MELDTGRSVLCRTDLPIREVKQMKNKLMKVEAPKKVEDGVHEGKIVAVEYREKPFEYTDLIIEFDGHRIKAGYPSFITPVNKLGKLMTLFGAVVEIGNELNPEVIFKGKECTFMTMTEASGFAKVVDGSLKPK